MKPVLNFVKSTLVGGIFFLVPIVLLIIVLTKAHEIMLKVAQPLSDVIPLEMIGGVTIANILVIFLLLLVCFLAGLLATHKKFKSAQHYIEEKILGPLPGYRMLKAYLNSLELYESREEKLIPVIVALEKHRKLGFEMERAGKDVVVFLPSAPNFISGSVVVVQSDQIQKVDIPIAGVKDCMEQFGFGVTGVLSKSGPA
jgi:uncharacterized membrane protein